MTTARERLLNWINEMPEEEIEELLYFLEHFKEKKDRNLADMGEIKIEYWDSDIYDEVWKEI